MDFSPRSSRRGQERGGTDLEPCWPPSDPRRRAQTRGRVLPWRPRVRTRCRTWLQVKSRWTVGGSEQGTPSSGRRRRPVSLPTVTHSGPSPSSTMSFFTKKPQSALGTKPSKPAAPKKATVVTKTLVKVPVKTRLGPPPPTSSAAPSSSSRPSSSATKRKPAPKKDERPPKVRRTSSFNKVQEQRVLPESDSSSDEEGGSSGRDNTPLDLTAEEYVVERPVAGPSSVSVEIWEGLVSAEQIVRQNQAKYKPCEFPTSSLPLNVWSSDRSFVCFHRPSRLQARSRSP